MTKDPINSRLGVDLGNFIDNDFPTPGRKALACIIQDLYNKNLLKSASELILELDRLCRLTDTEKSRFQKDSLFYDQLNNRISLLEWYRVFEFCERIYSKFLTKYGLQGNKNYISLREVKKYYSEEINTLLNEENLAFEFVSGEFHRKGKAHTQKVITHANSVLLNPKLEKVRTHFNKSKKFFCTVPEPDFQNCVKEAMCAVEACIEILTSYNASKEFDKVVKKLTGSGPSQIPAPIAEGLIKIHSYRGSGQGVSHASTEGYRVNSFDAELILSLSASYITYLIEIFPFDDEIPF